MGSNGRVTTITPTNFPTSSQERVEENVQSIPDRQEIEHLICSPRMVSFRFVVNPGSSAQGLTNKQSDQGPMMTNENNLTDTGTWRQHCPAKKQTTPMVLEETEQEPFPSFKPKTSVTSMKTLGNEEKQETEPEKRPHEMVPEQPVKEEWIIPPPEEFQDPTDVEQALQKEDQILQETLRTVGKAFEKQEKNNQILVAHLLRRVSELKSALTRSPDP